MKKTDLAERQRMLGAVQTDSDDDFEEIVVSTRTPVTDKDKIVLLPLNKTVEYTDENFESITGRPQPFKTYSDERLDFFALRPDPTEGGKTFTLEVVLADGSSTEHDVSTDAEYLGEALLDEGLIAGDESEYGLFITTVNGITANSENQEWWCLTVNGAEWMYGIDQTPVTDGEHYELTLMVGW